MEIIAAKFTNGQDVLARKVTRTKMSFGVATGEETVYETIRIFQVMRGPDGMMMALPPFSLLYPDITLTEAQWDSMVLTYLPTTKRLEDLYIEQTSSIQLTP